MTPTIFGNAQFNDGLTYIERVFNEGYAPHALYALRRKTYGPAL